MAPRAAVQRLPWRTVRNPHPPTRVLSEDQVEAIHEASLRVLRDHRHEGTQPEGTGAVRGCRGECRRGHRDGAVRSRNDRGAHGEGAAVVRHEGAQPPRSRSPSAATSSTSGWSADRRSSPISTVAAAPGTTRISGNFMKLSYSFDIIHLGGAAPLAPMDLPATTRHLDMYYAAITLHDKVWGGSMLGGYRAYDAVEMACNRTRGDARRGLRRSRLSAAGSTRTPRGSSTRTCRTG